MSDEDQKLRTQREATGMPRVYTTEPVKPVKPVDEEVIDKPIKSNGKKD